MRVPTISLQNTICTQYMNTRTFLHIIYILPQTYIYVPSNKHFIKVKKILLNDYVAVIEDCCAIVGEKRKSGQIWIRYETRE